MTYTQKTVAPPAARSLPDSREDLRPVGRSSRSLGLLLLLAGTLLVALAASETFAGTVPGGGGDDALRGSTQGERLSGFGGADTLHGLGEDDTLFGGEGEDELYGGGGRDLLLAGGGDDFVEAKDGGRDYVDCGPGEDVASVDFADRVATSCETVYPA